MNTRLIAIAILCVAFFSCKKEKVVKSTNISNSQAAGMVAMSLALNANGLTSIKNDIVVYARNLSNAGKGCGVIDSFAVARQETAISTINYNYALGYHYIVNCSNNIQDNLSSNIIYNGSFDAPNLTEINTVNSSINLTSLMGTVTTYSLNGSYQTSGSFQTIDATQLAGNNSINIDVKNLVVIKSNRNIVSGSANISVSGTIKTNKNNFLYNGTLVFKDANTAALTLEGINYSLNLTTADVTVL